MTTPINMSLYRLLVRSGATEQDAEDAARLDTTDLATRADLKAGLAELKSSLIMWLIVMEIAQTTLLVTLSRWPR